MSDTQRPHERDRRPRTAAARLRHRVPARIPEVRLIGTAPQKEGVLSFLVDGVAVVAPRAS